MNDRPEPPPIAGLYRFVFNKQHYDCRVLAFTNRNSYRILARPIHKTDWADLGEVPAFELATGSWFDWRIRLRLMVGKRFKHL